MGNTTNKKSKKNSSEPFSVLDAYWKKRQAKSLTKSQDNREIRKCFDKYDFNGSGALEHDEAICYISDLLKVMRLEKTILKEAHSHHMDAEKYLEKYVEMIFKEMDTQKTGVITFDQVMKPKLNEWRDFMRWISMATLHEIGRKEESKKASKKKKNYKSDSASQESEELHPEKEANDTLFETEEVTRIGEKALDEEGIMYLRQQKVIDVCEVLQLDKTASMMLLNKYNWDIQKLLEAYSEDPESTFKKAGMNYPPAGKALIPTEKPEDTPQEIECSICFDTKESFSKLEPCGHTFCDECWAENLTVQISEGQTLEIKCMFQGCCEPVFDEFVQKIVPEEVWDKYVRFLSKQFIESSRGVRWCPAPGCSNAIYEPTVEGDNMVGECKCGLIFCWHCKKLAHTPISCEEYGFWEKQNPELGQALLDAWLYQNTKKCPSENCSNYIEKNEGCFHMTCRCGFQFCWGCRKKWGTSGCNSGACATYKVTLTNKPIHHTEEGVWEDSDEKKFALLDSIKEYFQAEEMQKARDKPLFELIEKTCQKDGLFNPKVINSARQVIAQCRRIMKCMAIKLYFAKTAEATKEIKEQQERLAFLLEGLADKVEKDFFQKGIYDMKSQTIIQQLTNNVSQMIHNCLQSNILMDEDQKQDTKKKLSKHSKKQTKEKDQDKDKEQDKITTMDIDISY